MLESLEDESIYIYLLDWLCLYKNYIKWIYIKINTFIFLLADINIAIPLKINII